MKSGAAARFAAADILEQVVDARTGLDQLTDPVRGRPAFLKLAPRDRGLARAIVTVALRRRGAIERGLARFLDRPLPKKARHLAHLLHVAAAQVVFMDVPDRAAIDLAVEAAKRDPRSQRFAPLVNAVLRRVAEAKDEIAALSPAAADVPSWLWKAWRRDYGRDNALAIVATLRDEPSLDLTLRRDDAERPEGVRLANGTHRVTRDEEGEKDDVISLPGYEAGHWWVQDAAAALPAQLMGDIAGLRVLDACAAPGGKTAQLVVRGAKVTALDRAEGRLARLRENLARLGLEAETVAADLLEYEPPAADGPFDAVLLDAPCSSLGTLRRHPDVVWTKTEEDVAALAALQGRLLERSLALVRPGGLVVFANCSLMKAEGEALWQNFRTRSDVVPEPIGEDEMFGLPAVTGQGTLRTLPFHGFPTAHLPSDEPLADEPPADDSGPEATGMDGFFAARFRRAV